MKPEPSISFQSVTAVLDERLRQQQGHVPHSSDAVLAMQGTLNSHPERLGNPTSWKQKVFPKKDLPRLSQAGPDPRKTSPQPVPKLTPSAPARDESKSQA